MIKLIASDMDGTLLDENKQLPAEFKRILEKIIDSGAEFVVASGRSYVTLYKNFSGMEDKINYICDNGAYIVINGNPVHIEIMDKVIIRDIVKECCQIPNTSIILCGLNGTYHLPYDKRFINEVSSYYVNHVSTENLAEVNDDIFKIAICDLNGPSNRSYKILNDKFGNDTAIQISGPYWMDIMNKGVNKGEALKKIQTYLSVSKNETMAFGDYYNDIELLQNAEYSYVMKNAPDDMFRYGKYIAEPNSEHGVIKVIEKYF